MQHSGYSLSSLGLLLTLALPVAAVSLDGGDLTPQAELLEEAKKHYAKGRY